MDKEFVCFNGSNSDLKSIDYGVIQSSICGPILFIIFINDVVRCTNLVEFVMYADDTTVYLKSDSARDCSEHVNEGLQYINQWLYDNALTINTSKCEYILFSRKQKNFDDSLCTVNINGQPLVRKSCVKFLGVNMDENLLWGNHIDGLVGKLSKFVSIIYRIRERVDRSTLKMIYNSLIYPNLVYCNTVWGGACKARQDVLYKYQNKIVRALCNYP